MYLKIYLIIYVFRNGCYAFLIQRDDPPTKQGDRVWREMAQQLIFENSEDPNTYLFRNSSCPRILQKFRYVADCFPILIIEMSTILRLLLNL